jgi:4-hydroxy-tetrahydrodipicolinate synthase
VDTNFFPELSVWLCKNFQTAPAKQIHEVEQFLIQALNAYADCYPRSSKWFLEMRGVDMGTHCRREGVPSCTEKSRDSLAGLYRDGTRLAKQLNLCKAAVET